MKRPPISRKRFATWLRENQDLRFERCSWTECPVAIFLGGGCDHEVVVDCTEIEIDKESFKTPKWIEEFIWTVDTGPGTVTARQALIALGEQP